ncbi:hypothetical protein EPO33_05090 [Patescibacteria group bacterium]|nr:MAG: hypothetical protein EPO33_05090 [Patescibacteria group bacterium]
MDVAIDDAPQSAPTHPRILPILRRLVSDPCREWIDSPDSSSVFDWGDFRYCRQRREDGLTVFIGLTSREMPDRFAVEKIEWSPVWPADESRPTTGRKFELWCAELLARGQALPSIDGRIPAVGIDSWRGCSGGGGSRPYHILVERAQVLAHLEELDGRQGGLRHKRCGISRGNVVLLFPQIDENDFSRRHGFKFLVENRDAADELSRRWTGMKPADARTFAADIQAISALLEDPEIAALEWPK